MYPHIPIEKQWSISHSHNCGAHGPHALDSIVRNVAVLDMSLLDGYISIIGVYRSVGYQPIPNGGVLCTPATPYSRSGASHSCHKADAQAILVCKTIDLYACYIL